MLEYKTEAEATAEEKVAIAEWFEASHPTNHPAQRETARWAFRVSRKKLYASLLVGYAL